MERYINFWHVEYIDGVYQGLEVTKENVSEVIQTNVHGSTAGKRRAIKVKQPYVGDDCAQSSKSKRVKSKRAAVVDSSPAVAVHSALDSRPSSAANRNIHRRNNSSAAVISSMNISELEAFKYASFKIVQELLVKMAHGKLASTMSGRIAQVHSPVKVPSLFLSNYLDMDMYECRRCARADTVGNIECLNCNVAMNVSRGSKNQSTYFFKSVEDAMLKLGEDIVFRKHIRSNVVAAMLPVCTVDEEIDSSFRRRGVVVRRNEEETTVFFPLLSGTAVLMRENNEAIPKDVVLHGLKSKLAGNIEIMDTKKVRLVKPISLSHEKNGKIAMSFEWAIFNTLNGTAVSFRPEDHYNETESI